VVRRKNELRQSETTGVAAYLFSLRGKPTRGNNKILLHLLDRQERNLLIVSAKSWQVLIPKFIPFFIILFFAIG
jgi:hypothetical protein